MLSRLAPLLLGLSLCSCLSKGPSFEIAGGVMAASLGGDVALDSSLGIGGVDVDLGSDLDLGGTDLVPTLRGEFAVAGLHLRGNAFRIEQAGTGTLSASFGDIQAGADVVSSTELTTAQAALTFDVLDLGYLRISPGIGADYFDLDLQVREPTFGLVQELEVSGPLPMAVLDLEIAPPVVPLRLKTEVGALVAEVGDYQGTLVDGQVLLYLDLPVGFELFGGYRLLLADIEGRADEQDFDANIELSGWMIGGGFRF